MHVAGTAQNRRRPYRLAAETRDAAKLDRRQGGKNSKVHSEYRRQTWLLTVSLATTGTMQPPQRVTSSSTSTSSCCPMGRKLVSNASPVSKPATAKAFLGQILSSFNKHIHSAAAMRLALHRLAWQIVDEQLASNIRAFVSKTSQQMSGIQSLKRHMTVLVLFSADQHVVAPQSDACRQVDMIHNVQLQALQCVDSTGTCLACHRSSRLGMLMHDADVELQSTPGSRQSSG